jgi:hypothetical protein
MIGGSLGKISTKGDWSDAKYIFDEETNDPLDMTGCEVEFNVTPLNSETAVLTGSTSAGEITLPDTGYIAWAFPATSLSSLCSGTYDVGIVVSRDDETLQLFLGTVTIERGR